jgi:hypothetical protein
VLLARRALFSASAVAKKSVPAFAFDIDGVLLKSGYPIPGAKEALHKGTRPLKHLSRVNVCFVY